MSFLFVKNSIILLKIRENISKTLFILVSATKKSSLKKHVFIRLFLTWKPIFTIWKVLKVDLSVFWISILLFQI